MSDTELRYLPGRVRATFRFLTLGAAAMSLAYTYFRNWEEIFYNPSNDYIECDHEGTVSYCKRDQSLNPYAYPLMQFAIASALFYALNLLIVWHQLFKRPPAITSIICRNSFESISKILMAVSYFSFPLIGVFILNFTPPAPALQNCKSATEAPSIWNCETAFPSSMAVANMSLTGSVGSAINLYAAHQLPRFAADVIENFVTLKNRMHSACCWYTSVSPGERQQIVTSDSPPTYYGSYV